jgi:MFS superfamily sulfate permease-like transporter
MAAAPMINTTTKLLIGIIFSVISACVLALSMNASHAIQVYKSIGAHGEVKYSQHAPQNGNNVEVIEFRSDGRQSNIGQLAGKTDANQNDTAPDAEQQRVAQLEARIKEQEANANAQRCQSLRNNLTNLNVGGRIYEMDASGKRQYLDSREIELKRERVQQAISQYCSN